MRDNIWLMIMDLIVMGLLAAMLFYAIRLSRQLKDFRDGRKDLDRLVGDLSLSVAKAEKAILGLKENAKQSGRDLQSRIDDAKALSDELQLIMESSSNIAARLEGGVTKPARPAAPARSNERARGFAIRDTEYEQDDSARGDGLFAGEENDTGEAAGLHSRAEKELYEALRGGRKSTGAGNKP